MLTGTQWGSNCLVWGHLMASGFTNPFNCVGLDRSAGHRKNTRGSKIAACVTWHAEVKTATGAPLLLTVSFRDNYGKFWGGRWCPESVDVTFQWSRSHWQKHKCRNLTVGELYHCSRQNLPKALTQSRARCWFCNEESPQSFKMDRLNPLQAPH